MKRHLLSTSGLHTYVHTYAHVLKCMHKMHTYTSKSMRYNTHASISHILHTHTHMGWGWIWIPGGILNPMRRKSECKTLSSKPSHTSPQGNPYHLRLRRSGMMILTTPFRSFVDWRMETSCRMEQVTTNLQLQGFRSAPPLGENSLAPNTY